MDNLNNEPVTFLIKLKDDKYSKKVISKLESLAEDLHLQKSKNPNVWIHGSTSQETYEDIFDASIYYQTKMVKNINHGSYEVNEWKESSKAKVPKGLEKKIDYIMIDQKMYLTD